jgi:hypothetical protein
MPNLNDDSDRVTGNPEIEIRFCRRGYALNLDSKKKKNL